MPTRPATPESTHVGDFDPLNERIMALLRADRTEENEQRLREPKLVAVSHGYMSPLIPSETTSEDGAFLDDEEDALHGNSAL
jgi:hypothetical protein